MKKDFLVFFCFLSFASAEEFKLRPFFTDGCSGVLDADYLFTGKSYVDCCIVHDIAYWKGGSLEEKERADKVFGQCISEKLNPFLGSLFEQGVKYGGSASFDFPWRWGYGWYPKRPPGLLSGPDWKQVEALIPQSAEDLVIPGEQEEANSTKFHPSLTGNHCLDSIYTYISPMEVLITITDISYKDTKSGSKASVHIEGCDGSIDFFFSADRKSCSSRYSIKSSKPEALYKYIDNTENCSGLARHLIKQSLAN